MFDMLDFVPLESSNQMLLSSRCYSLDVPGDKAFILAHRGGGHKVMLVTQLSVCVVTQYHCSVLGTEKKGLRARVTLSLSWGVIDIGTSTMHIEQK